MERRKVQMKRMLRSLGAFALSLVLMTALFSSALAAEKPAPAGDYANYVGYLVELDLTSTAALTAEEGQADLFGTVRRAAEEMEELLPISEELGIYKIGEMSRIRSLVYGGFVDTVEPDYEAELFDTDYLISIDPNDPSFNTTKQYGLKNTDAGIRVQSAWEAGLSGDGVTVAIIDSGLNFSHVDVPAKIGRGIAYYYREKSDGQYELTVNGVKKKYGYFSNTSQSAIADDIGHGTSIAGIIASPANNGKNIAGIAPNVTILPIKCFTKEEGKVGGLISNLISGIEFATKNGADIINMSWGVRSRSDALEKAINAAREAGCILVAAAGNDGSTYNQSSNQYPAALDNVISVGATNQSGALAYYSQRNSSVDLCAPGSLIYSISSQSNTGLSYGDGTSFSAPMVAAAIALLKESDPALTQEDFLERIQGNCDPIAKEEYGKTDFLGAGEGKLNLAKLLDAAGHTGLVRTAEGGTVKLQGSFHPASETTDSEALILLCGYNAAGHLLESTAAIVSRGTYGSFRFAAEMENPEITNLRAFFLKTDGTLAAFAPAVERTVFHS